MRLSPQRVKNALHYISGADPIYKWRISSSVCPSCGGKRFISFRSDAFMTRCLNCFANGTNLSLIPVIINHKKKYKITDAYEMSTYGSTLDWMRRNIVNVTTSEFFPDKPFGKKFNGVLNQDVQKLTFKDSSFDLITSNQVFEHVPNDILGYSECYRILRRDGALIFSVPLYDNIRETKMLAELVDNKIIFYGRPKYHDSRLAGPKSQLTFWHHSVYDICQRVNSVGFITSLIDIVITSTQEIPTKVVYAVKL